MMVLAVLGCNRQGGDTAVSEDNIDLFVVSGRAFQRFANVGYDKLSDPERVFVAIWSLEAEVNNGGFDQYFFNSAGDLAEHTPAALEAIGASHTAEIVRQANRLFGRGGPSPERNKRQKQLESLPATASNEFDRLDEAFYEYEDDLETMLKAYTRKHKKEFK
jgi:hypothetical protein